VALPTSASAMNDFLALSVKLILIHAPLLPAYMAVFASIYKMIIDVSVPRTCQVS